MTNSRLTPTAKQPYLVERTVGSTVQRQLWTKKMWDMKVSQREVGKGVIAKEGWKIIQTYGGKGKTATPPEAKKATPPKQVKPAGIDFDAVTGAIIVGDTDALDTEVLIELVADKKWQIANYRKLPRTKLLGLIQERLLNPKEIENQEDEKKDLVAEENAKLKAELEAFRKAEADKLEKAKAKKDIAAKARADKKAKANAKKKETADANN